MSRGIHVGANGAGGGDTSIGPTLNTLSGSVFVACVLYNGTFISVSDTINGVASGNTWVEAGTEQTGVGIGSRIFYVENGNGGTNHVATISATGSAQINFLEIRGARKVFAYDSAVLATALDVASPFTVTSGTLSNHRELVVVFPISDTGSNPAPWIPLASSGFTVQHETVNGVSFFVNCVATKITEVTTALTPSFTNTGATTVMLKIIGFIEDPTQYGTRPLFPVDQQLLYADSDEGRFNELDIRNWV